jgi:hypothetical protein
LRNASAPAGPEYFVVLAPGDERGAETWRDGDGVLVDTLIENDNSAVLAISVGPAPTHKV